MFDRLTPHSFPLVAPPPPAVSFDTFRRMVQNLVPDSDAWSLHVELAYDNVPPGAAHKHEYDVAVRAAVRSIEARKQTLSARPKWGGATPRAGIALPYLEGRAGGDEL